MDKKTKLLMLGVDAALPDLIKKFSSEGILPNISKLMNIGYFSRTITTFPPLTAAAWGAIVSGAGPGTCGIPSLMVREPGEELDEWHTSFDKRKMKAETLWEAEKKADRTSALINWPVTWPMEDGIENGIQIAASLNPPFRFFYMPLWDIANSSLFASKKYRCNQVPGRAVVKELNDAKGWDNLPESYLLPKEFEINVPPVYAEGPKYQVVIISDEKDLGYNQMIISSDKNADNAVACLKENEWSDWIEEDFIDNSKESKSGTFRFYVPKLSQDAQEFSLFASAINTKESYTAPSSLQKEIEEVAGPYMEVDDPWAFMDGWVELDQYLNQLNDHVNWWSKTTKYVIENKDVDSIYTWVGTVDHAQHVLYGGIDPKSKFYDPEESEKWMDHMRTVYKQIDRGIGEILENVNLDETLVTLVSDHGFSTLEWNPYLKYYLREADLLSYEIDPESGEMIIDWSKTKCFPLEPCHAHLFINLKGRDPQGIVEPEDYHKVQREIIDALLDMKNPINGERMVELALPKEEAGQLGNYEFQGFDKIGDVLFALKTNYMANPFAYQSKVQYPDGTERIVENTEKIEPAEFTKNFSGVHLALPWNKEMHASLILAGKGIDHNESNKPLNIIDVAPTISKILDIPKPKHAEGNFIDELM
ncbi:alkaline phosphatase family protein [Halanaerobium sp. Z-7514]|uniref:Alkaline phosphatase family protein n=1 Tax=Halanaerobium polyolivorans TaxID=2886943 RepID=A0AAW4X1S5_9FIRM|nr:alkaline phosphatase family protein [Halanaerobium polyolivorans]MCC3145781.1 alkaline phosphatase family protein [Halanaerobium polyolivorans]